VRAQWNTAIDAAICFEVVESGDKEKTKNLAKT
jgi:hypothetical protein